MGNICVRNEVGKLSKILLHRPGKELLNLTPDSLSKLLFDDIPYLPYIQREHDEFARTLKKYDVEVVYLEDLMAEVIDLNDDIKNEFIEKFMDEAGIHSYKHRGIVYKYLTDIKDSKNLILKTMEGIQLNAIPRATKNINNTLDNFVNAPDKFIADPMPNIYYTRDNFSSIGDGVELSHMYSSTRNRECIYSEFIFKYHPDYKNIDKYYTRKYNWNIEGGDILNINKHVVAIGISERTSSGAIDQISKNFFKNPNCKIDTVLVFNLPKNRAYMHLDAVFNQADKYTFVYHPAIMKKIQMFEITEGNNPNSYEDINIVELKMPLEKILEKYLCHEVKLIPCAGGDKVASEREQWNGACSFLAVAPGVVISYDRNEVTNELLRKNGIKVIEIHSSELSRGRGGPRCMSMPLIREEINEE